MVGRVARRVDSLERPAGTFNDVAIPECHIGREVIVSALFNIIPRFPTTVRAEAVGFGAARLFQVARGGRMVAVGVGDQQVAHCFTLKGAQQRIDMAAEVRPGVDHRHLAAPDNISAGAVKGERPGIVGDHAPD